MDILNAEAAAEIIRMMDTLNIQASSAEGFIVLKGMMIRIANGSDEVVTVSSDA